MKKIPVIVLAGFLGAGKTTLLNHILKQSLGLRIGVIVNDFGAVNVDALLVAKQTDQKVELSNGCMCCTLGEGGIDETLEQLAYSGSPIDAIVIEASGIAEPGEIAFLVQASKNKHVEFAGIVYVIDAENFHSVQQDVTEHIKLADIILLNKADLVAESKLKAITESCEALNARAPILATTHGQLDPHIFFDIERPQAVQLSLVHALENNHSQHLHAQYQSVSFETEKPLDPIKVQKFLKRPPRGVYRMKGFAYFGMKGYEQKFLLQMVGKRHELIAEEWTDTPRTQLVCIALNMTHKELQMHMEGLVDTAPDNLTNETMLRSFM